MQQHDEVSNERMQKLGRSAQNSLKPIRNIPSGMSAQFESSGSEGEDTFEPLYIPDAFKKTREERVIE